MRRRTFSLAVYVVLALACLPAAADKVQVTGEFLYGPDVSEKTACDAAEQRAKEEAVRRVSGEMVSAEDQLSCRETSGKADSHTCSFNRFAWSTIDGDIKEATLLREPQVTRLQGVSKCSVSMQVDVVKPTQAPDPGFDFGVKLSAGVLKPGDEIVFEIAPSTPMYLAVFGWTPIERDKGRVVRLFPNAFDGDPQVKTTTRLPSAGNAGQYGFYASWMEGVMRDFLDEYLVFVATKSPVNWLGEYAFDDFRAALREIPAAQKRVHRRAYRIINQGKG